MTRKPRLTTKQRGLAWRHVQARAELLKHHVDGTPCWWCGRGLFREAALNFDHRTLSADHTVPRIHGGVIADRLLHSKCNEQRGDGSRDDQRPALTGNAMVHLDKPDLGVRAMPWPDR